MSRLEIVVSTRNSTTTPLGANAWFTGLSDDLTSFQEIDINVFGTPSNAPGVLYFEFSPDGTHWDVSVPRTIVGPMVAPIPLRVVLPHFRIRYENGSTPLTELRLTTVLHRTGAKQLTRFLDQDLNDAEPIEVSRTVVEGRKLGGGYAKLPMADDGLSTKVSDDDLLAAVRTLDSGVFSGPFTAGNGDVVTLVAAMPVAMPASTLVRGRNNSGFALANVVGLVAVGAGLTLPVRALALGVLTLPSGVWDAVTGQTGGLSPGARYYLDSALGKITTTAPTTPGTYVTVMGNAISAVTFLVSPEAPILL